MDSRSNAKLKNSDTNLVILIPGLDGSGKLFKFQTENFRKKNLSTKIVNLHTKKHQSIESHSRQVLELLERYKNYRIHLFGESYGACVALQVLAQAPANLASAVLMNPLTAIRRTSFSQFLPNLIGLLPRLVWTPLSPALMLASNSIKHFAREDLLLLVKVSAGIPRTIFSERLREAIHYRPDYHALRNNKFPVVLLASGNDRMMPSALECQDQNRLIANSTLRVLEGLDHQCLLDRRLDLSEIMVPLINQEANLQTIKKSLKKSSPSKPLEKNTADRKMPSKIKKSAKQKTKTILAPIQKTGSKIIKKKNSRTTGSKNAKKK